MARAKGYNEAGIPLMASLATPSRISQLGVFRTSLSDALAAEKLAQYIAARHRAVAVFTEENDYSVSFAADFMRSSQKLGLSVQNENYLPDQKDFSLQLLRLKNEKAEAIFLNIQTEEALALFVKQLRALQFSPRLYGAYLPGSAHFLEIAAPLAQGLVLLDFPGAEDMLTPEGQKLYAEFVARFGKI
jgi:ABC-type branched-subunit amino acid transport system substrate-binding protein